MTPGILLAATARWVATARLAQAFVRAGCEVEVVCPRGHPVTRTRAASRIHAYNSLAPLRSTRAAIEAAQPDFIIPCDDLATANLYRLHSRTVHRGAPELRAVLEGSLGKASSVAMAAARSRLMTFARRQGIRVPFTAVAHTAEELANWLARNGCLAVLKTDGSFGGRGVRVVHTPIEAQRAWRALRSPPSPGRAIKRAIINRDVNYVLPCVLRTRPVVNVQRFVAGQDANCTVACWKGKVLASITAKVLRTLGPQGPASVVQLFDNREITEAVEEIVGQLGLSGLVGADFVIEEGTGDAYLIEINPRAPQIGHLQLGAGRDLPAALRAVLAGEPVRDTPRVTANQVIAFFPQEWLRDPTSEFLRTAYHDVPWDEPELVRASVGETRIQRAWAEVSTTIVRMKTRLDEGAALWRGPHRRFVGVKGRKPPS